MWSIWYLRWEDLSYSYWQRWQKLVWPTVYTTPVRLITRSLWLTNSCLHNHRCLLELSVNWWYRFLHKILWERRDPHDKSIIASFEPWSHDQNTNMSNPTATQAAYNFSKDKNIHIFTSIKYAPLEKPIFKVINIYVSMYSYPLSVHLIQWLVSTTSVRKL